MSASVCIHPIMRDSSSVSRYGSASSSANNSPASPTTLIAAPAVGALICQPTPKQTGDGITSIPSENRTCLLPEIPNSPSSRSVASSDSPLLLQMKNVCDKQSSVECSHHQTLRNSMFPNFRALQRLALSAKTRTPSLQENVRRSTSTYNDTQNQKQAAIPSMLSALRTPELHNMNSYPRHSGKDLQNRQSTGSCNTQTPVGFSSLVSLPGNRHDDADGLEYTSSDEILHAYAADHHVSSKMHKKKSAKNKKRKTRIKSKTPSLQKHSKDTKKASKTPGDRKGTMQDNSLGSLLRAMPVVVEPKKIEIYSSRYNKCDTENITTHQTVRNSPSEGKAKLNPLRKDSSQGIALNKLGTQDSDPVIHASRVSPRAPANTGFSGSQRDREDACRVTRVYLSDKQSGNLRECGLILPCAPPATPTPQMMQRYQYIPSMMDLRSQRAVRDRLSGMEQKAKKKQQQQKEEARKTEQQLHRDQIIAWKQRQRLEIYALNKIMTEFEEKNFQEFMKKMHGNTP